MNVYAGILRFSTFSKIPNLVHGFSTRSFGNMRQNNPQAEYSVRNFFSHLGIIPEERVLMNQVGGNTVQWVGRDDQGNVIDTTDGLLTEEKNVFLRVIAADCVPVLFYDQTRQVCGVVHAGWKGVYYEIVPVLLHKMLVNGSKTNSILVGIGPGIRSCCYSIAEKRADMFRKKFGEGQFLAKREGKLFLDLVFLIKKQLQVVGIRIDAIEDCNICTFDSEDFYSYRREGEDFGEFVGVIGVKQ